MTNYDDGAACAACGEDAVDALNVLGQHCPVPLCGDCMDHAVTFCGSCERRIWSKDGERVFGTPTLYCPACSEGINNALHAPVLPDMNGVRR